MPILPGDYLLVVTHPYRLAWVTALANLRRAGHDQRFRTGLDRIIGTFAQGECPSDVSKIGEPDVYSATVQDVKLHLLVDSRRMEIRVIRVHQLT